MLWVFHKFKKFKKMMNYDVIVILTLMSNILSIILNSADETHKTSINNLPNIIVHPKTFITNNQLR
jgi:hypothetical protein